MSLTGTTRFTRIWPLGRFAIVFMVVLVLAAGLGAANMSVLFKATDSIDFYYNSSIMGSFTQHGLDLGAGALSNITDGATDMLRFDGSQNVEIPNGDLGVNGDIRGEGLAFQRIEDQFYRREKIPGDTSEYYVDSMVTTWADRVHIVGGYDGNDENDHMVYNPYNNTWIDKPAVPDTVREAAVGTSRDFIHIAGGNADVEHHRYNPENNSWIDGPDVPSSGTERKFSAGVGYKNKFYVVGGRPDERRLSEWDEDSDSWTNLSYIPFTFYGGAVDVYNDHIYATSNGNIAKYDISADSWTNLTRSPSSHDAYTAGEMLGHYFYIFDGEDNGLERYDTRQDNWDTNLAPDPGFSNERHGMEEVNGRLFVMGSSGSELNYMYK